MSGTRLFAAALALALGGGCGDPLKDVPRPSGRVLMVGLDGATWDIIDPLIAQGRLPHFARLSREGSRGPLTSFAGFSPTLFTTIATGKTPEQHGILNFVKKQNEPYTNSDRRSRALWNVVSDREGRVNVVGWFMTWPADVVNGGFISDRSEGVLPGGASPRTLDVLVEQTSRELATAEAEKQAQRFYGPPIPEGGVPSDALREYRNFEFSNAGYYRTDRLRLEWIEELLRTQPADLNLVFFKGIDPVCHLGWIYADPEGYPARFRPPPPALARYGDTIHRYYEFVDQAIGRLVEAAPGSDVVIVSDHGFGGKKGDQGGVVYNLNPLLARSGFIVTDAAGRPDVLRSLLFDPTPYWHEGRTLRELKVNTDLPASRAKEELLGRLKALRTPGGVPIFAEAKFDGPDQIDVRLEPRLEPLADLPDGDGLVSRRLGQTGGHRPQGIVLLAGPSVRAGARIGPANLYDVAPTVLRLLRLPGARDMKGRVLEEALRPEVLGPTPPPVKTYETGAHIQRLESAPLAGELDEEFRERLRSLGYIR